MIRLTTLGDVGLRAADGTVVGSVLNQPRRVALLVYLAVEATGNGVQRDQVTAVFWPDIPQANARQTLRSALHFLRRSLGPRAIDGNGEILRVDPDVLRCDATEFRRAIDEGRLEAALRLYEGPLLPAFHIDGGCAEFERWLDDARAGFRRMAADAAWTLAAAAEAAGSAVTAGSWARRATELAEGDEAAVRRCIDLLGRVGDRAGALSVYRDLRERLQSEFDAEPSAATTETIQAVRDAAGAVQVTAAPSPRQEPAPPAVAAASGSGSEPEPVPVPETRAVRRWSGRAAWGQRVRSAAVTLVLFVAFYSLWGITRPEPSAIAAAMGRSGVTVQVEELRDFSDSGRARGAAGALTLELTARLSDTDGLVVVAGAGRAPRAGTPTYLLRGGIVPTDSSTRVITMLIDATSGVTLDRFSLEVPLDDGVAAVEDAADELARAVRRRIGRAVDDHERQATARDARALALVRTALRDGDRADSLARAGAVDAASVAFAAADSLLGRAQDAAPRWSEPTIQRAELAFRALWMHLLHPAGDPGGAKAAAILAGLGHAERALAIAPGDPAALELRGLFGFWVWMTRSGGSEAADREHLLRAEADLRRATAADPGRARAWATLSSIYEHRGDFAAANHAAGRAYHADAYLSAPGDILVRLFTTSLEVGDLAGAQRWREELDRWGADRWLRAYCELELMAWREPAPDLDPAEIRRIIDEGASASPGGRLMQPRLEMLGAVVMARAGLLEEAERAIERGARTGGHDPRTTAYEAWARLTLGQQAEAATLLRQAATGGRGAVGIVASRRFAALDRSR